MFHFKRVAAANPKPFYKPRFIRWPSVCDTTRTNWLNPSEQTRPPAPLPGAESFTLDVGCHLHTPNLQPGQPLPEYLQNIETLVTPLATRQQQAAFDAHTFSHDAAATPLPNELNDNLYSTFLCGQGISPPPPPQPKPRKKRRADRPRKKLGRPAVFDEILRAQFCAMVQAGCTRRYAAQRLGISRGTITYTCRNEPQFADRLRQAEQQRDFLAVGRIQNAGEKSWRAAAWLLERNAPDHFSLRQQYTDPVQRMLKHMGKRRFKQLLAEAVEQQAGQQAEPAPPESDDSQLPQPKPRQLTVDAIEAKINELLQTVPSDERFSLMYRLGY
jgi:hypothetical protein